VKKIKFDYIFTPSKEVASYGNWMLSLRLVWMYYFDLWILLVKMSHWLWWTMLTRRV